MQLLSALAVRVSVLAYFLEGWPECLFRCLEVELSLKVEPNADSSNWVSR